MLAANEDGGPSSRRDTIKFARDDQSLQGRMQGHEMDIWNRQTER
jgi:hypothetical protein